MIRACSLILQIALLVSCGGPLMLKGKTGYVAPETFDPSAEVASAADVYGVGAVTYELVTGQLPVGRFEAGSGYSMKAYLSQRT